MVNSKFLRIEYERISDSRKSIEVMERVHPGEDFPKGSYAFKEIYLVNLDEVKEIFHNPESFTIYGENMRKMFNTLWDRIISIDFVDAEFIISDLNQMKMSKKSEQYRDLNDIEQEILDLMKANRNQSKRKMEDTFI